ncbi:MAG TPA: hypothetical protein GXX22_01705 [Clostridiales bacterium]|nr:hypothetical protein [Clostridiales bacterium]
MNCRGIIPKKYFDKGDDEAKYASGAVTERGANAECVTLRAPYRVGRKLTSEPAR